MYLLALSLFLRLRHPTTTTLRANSRREQVFTVHHPQRYRPITFHAMMSNSAHLLEMKSLSLLGSTGSIGANTLDVVRHNRHLYRIHASKS